MKKEYLLILFGLLSLSALTAQRTSTSILVVSGSTGGTAAAIQSARMGVPTILVESGPWLGGMLSAAGVTATDGNHQLPSGIWEELRQALYCHYGTKQLNTGWVSNTLFEPHIADSIFKAWAAKEKHLTVLYGWYFDSAYVEKGKIKSIRFINKQDQYLNIQAKIVVDGTDLGDVYANAGAGFDLGMESSEYSGEKEAPGSNKIIQDLTWAATLKDYGLQASEKILIKKESFDWNSLKEFDCSTSEAPCPFGKPYEANTQKVLDYGKLPKAKYMLNWPAHGNDYFIDGVQVKPINREAFYLPAKKHTLAFVYYLQNTLGFKHIGLDTLEFPSKDHLALMPYHREGRRLKGMVRLSLPHMHHPFEQDQALYRTGIAVGDYPVDHHHGKNPLAPKIYFPGIYSFNIPVGALIPEKIDGLVVCEKGISVSNLANGSTRLQPCVLLTGQSAGALAAIAVQSNLEPRQVSIRKLQAELLARKVFLMPYMDVAVADPGFAAIQRIGATGALRGLGKNEGWANKTYFQPDSLCKKQALINDLSAFLPGIQIQSKALQFESQFVDESYLKTLHLSLKQQIKGIPEMPLRPVSKENMTRKEVAIWLDKYCNLFSLSINHQGKWTQEIKP
jgi:hypothetical protein